MASKEDKKKSKKRKSLAQDAAGEVTVSMPESSVGVGPSFVIFPSVKPNKATTFTVYSRDAAASTKDITKQQTLIAGETNDVEYFSTNCDRNSSGEGKDCQYVAALFDPKTKTLHVHPTTPLYLLAHRAKRMRTAPLSASAAPDANQQWKIKRNDLGETFGTRKAKSQIKAEERNKVDVTAMQGVRANLIDSIGGTDGKEDDGVIAPPDVIPTPNLVTKIPAEVYSRQAIVPNTEWSSIDVAPLVKAKDDRERSAFLPYRKSRWIEDKIRVAIDGPQSARKDRLRMLFYLSCLMAWYNFAHQVSRTSVSDLPLKLQGIPPQVMNGLLQRFAEPSGKRYQVTDKAKTKLLMWICVCYLAADGWTVDIGRVAKDLSMTPQKITDLFKALGCSVDMPGPAERENLGISVAEAQQQRRATLKAPVKYPKTKRRGPAKH